MLNLARLDLASSTWEGNPFVRESAEALIETLKPPLTSTLEAARHTVYLLRNPAKRGLGLSLRLIAALALVALSYYPPLMYGVLQDRQNTATLIEDYGEQWEDTDTNIEEANTPTVKDATVTSKSECYYFTATVKDLSNDRLVDAPIEICP